MSDHELIELREDCAVIFKRLPPDLRAIAELLKSESIPEVARLLGMCESTVRDRVRELREHFLAEGFGD